MKTILCHTQSHANSTFVPVIGTTDTARKRDQPFEKLKMPRKVPIDNE